ncbi:MAG: hypothetical protein C5B55_10255 [Blastocatellia bacterium]|nr:MAG: hypothetical protein C5B55_10255 [Blastocatellia bacterium]
MNLGTLNTIIALVIVLLVLSLVVQSIQTALKKLFTLKSKQLEESLRDLYDQAIGTGPVAAPATGVWSKLGWSKRVWSDEAHSFTNGILQQFKNIGRVTRLGNPVLDSLSKDDLIKVIAKLELKTFFAADVEKFQDLCNQIKALREQVDALATNQHLVGSASAKISQLRAVLAPLFNDVQSIVDGNNKVKPQVVFGDLLRLGTLKVGSVLDLLAEAQTAINAELETARKSSPPADVTLLRGVANQLAGIAKLVGDLSQKFDQAFGPLRARLTQVETWFDTVSQSFNERYTRHMRTVSICISIVVVVLLNANFFQIYRNISTNEVQKNLIVEAGPQLLEEVRKSHANAPQSSTSTEQKNAEEAAQTTQTPGPTPSTQSSPDLTPANRPQSSLQESQSGNGQPATPQPTPLNLKKEAEETKQAIETYVNTYEQFGFSPLSLTQFKSFVRSSSLVSFLWDCDGQSTRWGCTIKRSEKGLILNKSGVEIQADCVESGGEARGIDCRPAWRPQTANEWWIALKGNVTTVLGWTVMVMLLSVGAPFWQDTLESLFGIKNLLRQKSATQNAETKSGAGQPRS